MPTFPLIFPNQIQDEAQLVLFWETAQPLRHVLAELPAIEGGPKINIKPVFPRAAIATASSVADLLNASVSSEIEFTFQNLPEPLFERLALRFRPFYANDEEVNLLRLANKLARLNKPLRPWRDDIKARWNKAVFWGTMGIPEHKLPVNAEEVISTGFYSRYFHFDATARQKAKDYEKSLGKEMFRIAIVSSVWERSKIVVEAASSIEETLIDMQLISEEAAMDAKVPYLQPDKIHWKLRGAVGAFKASILPTSTGSGPAAM